MSGIFTRVLRTWPIVVMAILAGCVVVEGPPTVSGPAYCTREFAPVCGRLGRDRETFPNACEADRAGYRILHAGRCQRASYDGPPPPSSQRFCTSQYDPVCARRGTDRRTFGNECEAERAGYRVIDDRACRRDRDDEARPRPDRTRDEPRPNRPRSEQTRPDRPRAERPERPQPVEQTRPDRPRAEQPRPQTEQPRPQPEQPRRPQPAEQQPPATPSQQACTRQYAPVCGQVGNQSRTFANACEARVGGARIVRQGAC